MLNRKVKQSVSHTAIEVNIINSQSPLCFHNVCVLSALNEPYPHWLIRVTGLHWPLLPLAAEQLLSQALLDDRVGI